MARNASNRHIENNLALLHGFLTKSACSITFENEQPQGTKCFLS